MILFDRDLRQTLRDRSIVEPHADLGLQLQPGSIDQRLDRECRRAIKSSEEVEEVTEGADFVLANLGTTPASLRVGSRICQIVLHVLTSPVERPHGPARGSTYSGRRGPTSRLAEDYTKERER